MEGETKRRLAEISKGEAGSATERVKFQQENEHWLKRSQAVAVKVLSVLRARGTTQLQLAEAMGVSAQQVSKIVKGKENLTLQTVSKLESALGIVLFDISATTSDKAKAV